MKFPVAPDKETELTALLEKKLPGATKTISLDRLEAALEADGEAIKGVEVKNDPPKIIIATKPSLLVLIDGMPQLREIEGTKLQRVINTRAVCCLKTTRRPTTCGCRIGGCRPRNWKVRGPMRRSCPTT